MVGERHDMWMRQARFIFHFDIFGSVTLNTGMFTSGSPRKSRLLSRWLCHAVALDEVCKMDTHTCTFFKFCATSGLLLLPPPSLDCMPPVSLRRDPAA